MPSTFSVFDLLESFLCVFNVFFLQYILYIFFAIMTDVIFD